VRFPLRILITGGAGFLGYHLAHFLALRGAQPFILDIAPANLAEYPPGTIFHVGDVRDAATVRHACRFPSASRPVGPPGNPRQAAESGGETRPIDVVVHAAAALPLWRSDDIWTTNAGGTRVVLEEARRTGVPRVVFLSSTAVYGVTDKHATDEDFRLVGVGPYGESKIVAERLCHDARLQGYCVPVLRPKTFIGTGRLGVFQILYDWVHGGKRIPVLGSGHNRYQLLDVQDLCDAIWRVATAPPVLANGTYNVGATRFGTVREDVGALCAHAGTGARVFPVPAWPAKLALRTLEAAHLSPLYRWIYDTADKNSYVSSERIRRALGWQPRYSNAESLIRAYDWYFANRAHAQSATGITHRDAWEQRAIGVLKRLL
jgi:nucleoside-diphosphate-sugar epimerase